MSLRGTSRRRKEKKRMEKMMRPVTPEQLERCVSLSETGHGAVLIAPRSPSHPRPPHLVTPPSDFRWIWALTWARNEPSTFSRRRDATPFTRRGHEIVAARVWAPNDKAILGISPYITTSALSPCLGVHGSVFYARHLLALMGKKRFEFCRLESSMMFSTAKLRTALYGLVVCGFNAASA